jgi:hypothetical protein
MTASKRNIFSLFKTRRVNIFLLFIVLAFVFSVLTKLSKNYTKTFSFHINTVNVPEDVVIINDSTINMRITITAYGFRQIKYYFKKPIVDVDFTTLDKSTTHYNWIAKRELSNIIKQFDINERIENIVPDTIVFKYDVNTVKKIPVILDADIKFSTGFDVNGVFNLTPDSINIIGPKVVLDSISEIYTERLELDNIISNVNNTVKLKLPSQLQDLKFSQQQVQVIGTVEKFTEGVIEVPVNVVNIPKNIKIKYYPKTIPVIYYTSLSNFKSISSSSFIVECDYDSLSAEDSYLIPKIVQQPDLVKNARLSIKRIEFILVQ